MRRCAQRAWSPQAVDAINAHGTGTLANDKAETAAIRAVFGERAAQIPISATKAIHGHLLGAAGALECVLSLLAMAHRVALPTMHLTQPDPDCDLDYVANQARDGVAARVMLSNSFAFGGTNAVLVLGAAVHHVSACEWSRLAHAAGSSRVSKAGRDDRVDQQLQCDGGPGMVTSFERHADRQMGAGAVATHGDPRRIDIEPLGLFGQPLQRRVTIVVGRRPGAFRRAPVVHAGDHDAGIRSQAGAYAVVRRHAAGHRAAAMQIQKGRQPARHEDDRCAPAVRARAAPASDRCEPPRRAGPESGGQPLPCGRAGHPAT